MENVTLTLQMAVLSVAMIVIIAIDLRFLVPITIKAGLNKDSGYCFGGVMLALTQLMFAVVFAYSLGIVEKMLKLSFALLMYICAEETSNLATKTVKENKKLLRGGYLILSMLSFLVSIALFIQEIP